MWWEGGDYGINYIILGVETNIMKQNTQKEMAGLNKTGHFFLTDDQNE